MSIKDYKVGDTWTTYCRADGEMIYGDYSFVTELEWFEEDYEPTSLVQQTWQLVETTQITVNESVIDDEDDD